MYVPRPSNEAAEPVGEKTSNSRIRPANNESASCCNRCTSNQPRDPRHQQRPLEFTPDMVKDQELLVSTLSQQGISESLIRRQFNKLLEEQTKQLALDREIEQRPPAKSSNDPREPANSSSDVRKRSEPSTLVRLRMKRETLDSRGRNNGLQDLVTAAKIIDKSKAHSECSNVGAHLRLNGTQDGAAPEAEAFCQAHCLRQPQGGKSKSSMNVSANGLENSREKKPKVPPQQQQQHQQHHQQQYQQQQYQQQQHQQQYCQPGGDVQHEQQQQQQQQHSNEQQQQQQPHDNHSTFYPDIQEPRVFGGFTYFARKPQLGCVPQFAQPHPQTPSVNTTRSTTAF